MTGTSPSEFMAAAPSTALLGGSSEWASRYAQEIRRVVVLAAAHAPRSMQVHLGPSEIGAVCLSGETEIVTRQGLRKIRDVAKEGDAELLVPMRYTGSEIRKRWGKFCRVPVEDFGEQELYEVKLHRNQDTKIVLATAEHHWFRSYWSGKIKKQEKLETRDLRPGHKLAQLRRARPRTTTLMPFAVAQGVVFGDGTKGSSDDRHRPAWLTLFHNGKDEALLKFFPGEHKVYHHHSQTHAYSIIRGLPRFWKALPPIDESTSFLMSWLAGYFAADGCVSDDGHCSISSAYQEHLTFVRDVAAICGIGYGRVQKHMRLGISGNQTAAAETPLYRLSLRRRDLPEWFFLTEQHAQRARAASLAPERDPHWIVESVRATGRTESVYCAITGDTGAFALADDLMTGNCDRQVIGKLVRVPATNHVSDPWPSIVGTAVHAWLAAALDADNRRSGTLRWLTEQRVTPHPDHPGTADAYDAVEQAVVDWKILGPTTMAKIKSPEGPPVHYVVQLLLYGRGYRLLGLPVRRVVLAALPRTSATLDGMYVWDRPYTPADDALIEEVLDRTVIRKAIANEILAGRMRLDQVPITPDDAACYFCLAGKTEVVTRAGIKPIAELAGRAHELLVPSLGSTGWRMRTGKFAEMPVHYFGKQPTYRIVLEDRRAGKEIVATAEHTWFVTDRMRVRRNGSRVIRHQWYKTTAELQPGDLLQPLRRAITSEPDRMDVAVAQGFVFGDGSQGQDHDRPATLAIYANGKDDVMLEFYPGIRVKNYDGVKHLYGLPRFWKQLPPLDESRAFLLSWLAGYFAADGNVSEGGQCSLASADEENLLFVRDLAAVCGIGYRPVSKRSRAGIHATEATDLFEIVLQRRDLPSWFFLIDKHRAHAEAANEKPERESYWKVVSAGPTGLTESVYCAVVDGIGAFGLADDLMTGNCSQYRPQSAHDGGPGCPGTIGNRP